uniref:Uncharacterized protein n=1 Tax=Arundo donax TaxID=35708 RepID=A0A0A8ZJJ2_ARUDO
MPSTCRPRRVPGSQPSAWPADADSTWLGEIHFPHAASSPPRCTAGARLA